MVLVPFESWRTVSYSPSIVIIHPSFINNHKTPQSAKIRYAYRRLQRRCGSNVPWVVVGGDVLPHIKRGNCPGGGNVGGNMSEVGNVPHSV